MYVYGWTLAKILSDMDNITEFIINKLKVGDGGGERRDVLFNLNETAVSDPQFVSG